MWVPGGSFMMGYANNARERPVHEVELDGFWIGQCEVTTAQFAEFLTEAQPDDVSEWIFIDYVDPHIELVGNTYYPNPQLAQCPVWFVTWYGAVAYCDHYGYVLPTEAQWEYAAAGPTSLVYPWGDTWDPLKCCNEENQGPEVVGGYYYGRTFEVGSFPEGASWCGALNMAGNVQEWCADWCSFDYYEVSPVLNPPGPVDGVWKVLRGGDWSEQFPYLCRNASRDYIIPEQRSTVYGFRVARNGS